MHKPVLDHGYVRLVSSMGDDSAIVRAARHSYDAADKAGLNPAGDARLIGYLMRNGHSTPFESVEFQFAVRAPIFVARQWMRHRTWSYNELSGRYRELPELFYSPNPDVIGEQSSDNKQVRNIVTGVDAPNIIQRVGEIVEYERACLADFRLYKRLLAAGWPRELARLKLPLSTYTDFFAKVDLHNLLHFLTLRLHPHAQYEIRCYAEAIVDLIESIVPVTVAAWRKRETSKLDLQAIITQLEDGNGDYDQASLLRDLRQATGMAA